jgi:putative transposase
MSRPLRVEYPGAVYHVLARGNEKRDVFWDDHDRERYLSRLAHYRSRFDFRVYAYCLMRNHVHLAIETGEIPLSRIMLALHGSYTQTFNRRHHRVGHLFQGRYKAFLVQRDRYLLALVRYIHQNPVAAGIEPRAWRYRWSSDRWYRRLDGPDWLDVEPVLALFAPQRQRAIRQYHAFMKDGGGVRYESLPGLGQVIKGETDFAIRVLRRTSEPIRNLRGVTAEQVARAISRVIGVEPEALTARGRVPDLSGERAIAAYVGREVAGIPLAKTARHFRRHESVLVRRVGRLEQRLKKDPALRETVTAVTRLLS